MSSPLPPRSARWFAAAGDIPLPPSEPRATCTDCAMCGGPGKPPLVVPPFDPTTTCCTYVPILPNHTVGRILADEDPELEFGRESVRARIARLQAVTPLGLDWPHDAGLLYEDREKNFGRNPHLRCPHHHTVDGVGRCGIWRHRNAVCSTWFCKHERGESGRLLWLAIRDLIGAIEAMLAWHCVAALGIEPARRELLTPRPGLLRGPQTVDGHPGGEPTRERRAALWGEWLDREEAFYLACAEIADAMSPADALRAGGVAVIEARAKVRARARALTEPPPLDPRPGKYTVARDDGATAVIRAYSSYDPLELPSDVAALLPHIDGRHLDVVRDAIGDEALSEAMLRRLLDWRVLERPVAQRT